MTATSEAREALAALSPYDRENHKVLVIVAELLAEQNDLLREQLEQQRQSSTTVSNVAPAGPSAGAGRPAAGDPPAGKEAAVRLTEPDVPPVDDDQGATGTTGGRPAPAKKATPAKRAAAAKSSPARGQKDR